LKKQVTDEEFETAYTNRDNKGIIRAVTKRYSKTLSPDEQERCGMHGLWRCIQSHNPKYGRKFTTSLFVHVDWECKREIAYINKKPSVQLGSLDQEVSDTPPSMALDDIMDGLPEQEKNIIYQRFYENRTLAEIGKSQGYSKEAARQNINKIISGIKKRSLS
jgi:RNA polymerase sigma factor (sigma-70 family)